MARQGVYGLWFYLLLLGFLVWPGQAQLPNMAQCFVSGTLSLIRPAETRDEESCRLECVTEPDCHMVLVATYHCLLVNCLNRGWFLYPRDHSTQFTVFPVHTSDKDNCSDTPTGCLPGSPTFVCNRTSSRCERSVSRCVANIDMFDTQEACESHCTDRNIYINPVNTTSQPAPTTDNLLNSVPEIQPAKPTSLPSSTSDVSAPVTNNNKDNLVTSIPQIQPTKPTRQPAATLGASAPITHNNTNTTSPTATSVPACNCNKDLIFLIIPIVFLMVMLCIIIIIIIAVRRRRRRQRRRSSNSDNTVEGDPES